MKVVFSDEQDDPLEPGFFGELADLVAAAEGLPDDTEVGITLVDEDAIAAHNAQALGGTGPTDVVAFPLEDAVPGRPPQPQPAGPPLLVGDVLVCPAVVRRNAADAGVPFEDELALIVVHGLLHLLGYDHVDDADAEQMEERERTLLAAAGRVRP
jgi:probable rRNA maturation factor